MLVRRFAAYRSHLVADLLAGATGAIAGTPQAMAFAIIAGISPVYGLYTAIVSTIVGTLVQSSTFMTIGPTNALALAVGSTLAPFAGDGSQIERLVTLTLLVGLFQLVFGLLRLGDITRFVSNAVMTGFITGAACLIIMGQLTHLVGYEGPGGGGALGSLWDLLTHLPQIDPATTVIGVMATVIIYRLHHTRYRSIATMTAIIITALLVAILGWGQVKLVRELSTIPNILPPFVLPTLQYAPDLLTSALAIALLALVQSAGISKTVHEPDGSTSNISRDFVGQGAANLAGAFFQNMPSGGSLSRTAVNVAAGARTRLANIYAGLMVAAILLLLGSLTERIPLAALAGHLLVAASSLIKLDEIRMVWRVSRTARAVMLATFGATMVLPLEYSIYIGVGLSLLMYAYTSSNRLTVVQLVPTDDHHFREAPVPKTLAGGQPTVIGVYGNLYFAAVETLAHALPDPGEAERPVVVLRLRGNEYLGSTGIHLLERYATQLRAAGGRLMLAGISPAVADQLERTGTLDWLGRENVFTAGETLFRATEDALQQAQEWLAAAR